MEAMGRRRITTELSRIAFFSTLLQRGEDADRQMRGTDHQTPEIIG
jgi:hypothetical protein